MPANLAAKHGFKFGTLDGGIKHPAAELIGQNPLLALPGNLGLERQFAVYHGLGKGWRLASPRLPPLLGGRAGPLLGFPVAKRVKSDASKSVNSGSCSMEPRLRGAKSCRVSRRSPFTGEAKAGKSWRPGDDFLILASLSASLWA